MNYCFFLYLKNINTISFSLDNYVWERRNVVDIFFNRFLKIS